MIWFRINLLLPISVLVLFDFSSSFQIIQEAFENFQREFSSRQGGEQEKQDTMAAFYSTPANTQGGTTSYIAKAIVNQLLDGNIGQGADSYCAMQ